MIKSSLLFIALVATFGLRAFVDPLARFCPGCYNHMKAEESPAGRLKVYVYDMPSEFNQRVVENDLRCLTHMFATEIYIHLFLLSSSFRTLDPSEADWFYAPVYTTCDLTTTGLPLVRKMPYMMSSAIQYISTKWPYWNRTDGADHFFVVPHDYGACFHYKEKTAIAQGILPLLKHSTLIQTFGQQNHPCFKKGSIVVPPYVSLRRLQKHALPANTPRSIFAYFRGALYSLTNDTDGSHYARGVREAIWESFKDNPLFDISPEHPDSYYEDMQRSIFCICPLGWAPWSPRIVEAVALGCIPVIVADDIVLPFQDVVPWADIAVFVAERDVPDLARILTSISMEAVTRKQKLLSDSKFRQVLLFPERAQQGDGFHQVIKSLARKLPRPKTIYKDRRQSTARGHPSLLLFHS